MANHKKNKGVQLDKDKLGNKWICPTTGKKFYDLNKEPVTSPYTGEIIELPNTEDSEKEKNEKIILENDSKETSQISEAKETIETDNVESDANGHEITCATEDYNRVSEALFMTFGVPEEAGLVWRPQNTIEVNEAQASTLIKLMDVLDDNDDVQSIASNFDISDDVMAKLA